jgi:hypothetical protein
MRNVMLARILGILSIVLLSTLLWFGWWMLAVAGAAAVAANLVRPRSRGHAHQGRVRRAQEAVQRRLLRHTWRPQGPA